MILIYCEGVSGQVGMKECMVEGFSVLARRYDIVDHFLAVDCDELPGGELINKHDAEDILALGSLYRLATPKERNAYEARARAASAISEQVGG